jgi:hypothetical protein
MISNTLNPRRPMRLVIGTFSCRSLGAATVARVRQLRCLERLLYILVPLCVLSPLCCLLPARSDRCCAMFTARYPAAAGEARRKGSIVVAVYSADRHRIDIAKNKYYNTLSMPVDPCPLNGLVLTAQEGGDRKIEGT